jgi:hypothetical protein
MRNYRSEIAVLLFNKVIIGIGYFIFKDAIASNRNLQ